MVIATTMEAASSISEQFKDRTIEKHYLAICKGLPRTGDTVKYAGKVNTYLDYDPKALKSANVSSEFDVCQASSTRRWQ